MSPKRTDWLLPLALGAVQTGVWPGPALFGRPPAVIALVLTATVVVVAALAFRRIRPVASAIVVHAATMTAQVSAEPLGAGGVSLADVLSVAPLISLFSVAAWTGVRTTVALTVALTAAMMVANAFTPGYYAGESGAGLVLLVVADALIAALAALFGHRRRVWRHGRETARRRLAEAETARAEAAREERHRLARELHDVSAHHLTAIVVTVTAARRLAEKRPELGTEALTFAAQAARRTLDTLFDLVAVMRSADATGDLPARLAGLAAEFQRLGQPVTLAPGTPGAVPADVADTTFAIVREALTNTLRYAPGGAVTIRVTTTGGAVEAHVTNAAATRPSDADGVGSGSGLAGARTRAERLGGTLTAGPAGGGWQVTARLPLTATAPSRLQRAWQGRAASVRGYLTDALVTVALAMASIAVLMIEPAITTGGEHGAALLAGAVLILHAAPLTWAHRAPWRTLAAVLAVLVGWTALTATDVLPAGSLSVLIPAGFVEAYAVYAVAAHGRGRAAWTWLVAPVTGAVAGLAITVGAFADIAAADPADYDGAAERAILTVMMTVVFGGLLTLPLLATWATGAGWRRRRTRLRDRERDLVLAATVSATGEALAERWRIAAELRTTVLARATDVLTAATRPADVLITAVQPAEPAAGVAGLVSSDADRDSRNPAVADPGPAGTGHTAAERPPAGPAGADSVGRHGDPGGWPDDTAARLDAVLAAARATLAAMRELLGSLRGGARGDVAAQEAETAPQPTAAQIGALCEAQRAAGRAVMLRYATPLPDLPPGVDVSAYRLVEAALALPGPGPLEIVIGAAGGLRIFLNRIPALTDPRAAAGLRGRVDAVGGTMTVHPAGETDILLPLPTPPPAGTVPAAAPTGTRAMAGTESQPARSDASPEPGVAPSAADSGSRPSPVTGTEAGLPTVAGTRAGSPVVAGTEAGPPRVAAGSEEVRPSPSE
ncbi:histidine kinase [Catenuloplanes indicus]|uniref:histidine kinase n=1 Tax=Catenuloplanes indicus TaxID=137267 RepID=A0AAE4AUE3_9ACTN|nr:histidine kinase [Catenuloplanes indicus]MDQ0363690.1 signal transduction histidine kinase [Catenuloplanes indicus]